MQSFKHYPIANRLRAFLFSLVVLFSSNVSTAQIEVWPGDASNNGEVNNIDYLFIWYAEGQVGIPRIEPGIFWQAYPAEPWNQNFPGTTLDFAYADCDGDGLVNENNSDIATVSSNYGQVRDGASPEDLPVGVPGMNIPLRLERTDGRPLFEGDNISTQLILGDAENPVENFKGLAFSLEFDPEVISNGFSTSIDGNSWINQDNTGVSIQQRVVQAGPLNERAMAIGKPNGSPSGFGPILNLGIIIEDNVISLEGKDSITTYISIQRAGLKDSTFNWVPLATDSLEITIYNQNSTITTSTNDQELEQASIQIYPNPSHGLVQIGNPANIQIQEFKVFDAQGRLVQTKAVNEQLSSNTWQLDASLPDGLYLIQTLLADGQAIAHKLYLDRR